MKKININSLIKRLPVDMSYHATRDLCVLTSAIFGETHIITLKRDFGAKFSSTFWCMKKGRQVILYDSPSEYGRFSEQVGKCCLNPAYTKKLTNELIKRTNWINNFLKKQNSLNKFLEKSELFIKFYRDYFAYHQAVYWAGEYLTGPIGTKIAKKSNKIVLLLQKAYKYNELIVPKVEKYFHQLKIDHLLPEEISKSVQRNIKQKPKLRSVLFLGRQRYVFGLVEARKLEQAIITKEKNFYKEIRQVKGICAQPGQYRGKVRVIKNLYKLKLCRPGEILVTTMTRPQFNKVIKKVGAIVTDEGGILSHAAILAREFRIPCVVGTKIATKIFKNGERIKVEATKGVIEKIV